MFKWFKWFLLGAPDNFNFFYWGSTETFHSHARDFG